MENQENIYKGIDKKSFFATVMPIKSVYEKLVTLGKFQGRFNDYLISVYANYENTEEFNTFKGWQDLGYKVKKGEKSYRIFSKPKKIKTGTTDHDGNELTTRKYFQSCIFSKNQVEKIAA